MGSKFRPDRNRLDENGGGDGLQGFQIDFKDVENVAKCKISLFVGQLTEENGSNSRLDKFKLDDEIDGAYGDGEGDGDGDGDGDGVPWSGRCGGLVDSAYTNDDTVFSVRCNRLLVTWILPFSMFFWTLLILMLVMMLMLCSRRDATGYW